MSDQKMISIQVPLGRNNYAFEDKELLAEDFATAAAALRMAWGSTYRTWGFYEGLMQELERKSVLTRAEAKEEYEERCREKK